MSDARLVAAGIDVSVAGVTFTAVRDVLLWTMVVVTVWSGYIYVQRAIELLRPKTPA